MASSSLIMGNNMHVKYLAGIVGAALLMEGCSWLSGQHGEEGGSMRGAANDLRNQAAAMGGNVIYGISSPSQGMLSSFVPTDSQIIGQVYKCPN